MARFAYRTPFQPPTTFAAGSTAPLAKYVLHSSDTNCRVRVKAEAGVRGIMWILSSVTTTIVLRMWANLPLDVLQIGPEVCGMIDLVLE